MMLIGFREILSDKHLKCSIVVLLTGLGIFTFFNRTKMN